MFQAWIFSSFVVLKQEVISPKGGVDAEIPSGFKVSSTTEDKPKGVGGGVGGGVGLAK